MPIATDRGPLIAHDADLTQLTICNYDSYQATPGKRDADLTQNRRTTLADDAAARARAGELAEQVYDIFGLGQDEDLSGLQPLIYIFLPHLNRFSNPSHKEELNVLTFVNTALNNRCKDG